MTPIAFVLDREIVSPIQVSIEAQGGTHALVLLLIVGGTFVILPMLMFQGMPVPSDPPATGTLPPYPTTVESE